MTNTKGFTLVELLVVISIIAVLVLMGLRLYLVQQDIAKNAIVKANVGTIQTLIQANMADTDYDDATPAARIAAALGDITDATGCHNPYTGGTGNINVIKASGDTLIDGDDIDYGKIAIASPEKNVFKIQGLDQDGKLFGEVLQAIK
ncbi:MAG: prepilin-type N-terminal cleavage/methylation domain-containing protein [Candidatus Atribacteria bacterium]|nr:prepilin-type N-terminal cleavage/methylation domain-containing protein [Candidatus Atribacteria bacterium]